MVERMRASTQHPNKNADGTPALSGIEPARAVAARGHGRWGSSRRHSRGSSSSRRSGKKLTKRDFFFGGRSAFWVVAGLSQEIPQCFGIRVSSSVIRRGSDMVAR